MMADSFSNNGCKIKLSFILCLVLKSCDFLELGLLDVTDPSMIQLNDNPDKEDFFLFYTKTSALNLFKCHKFWPLQETWNLLQDFKIKCFDEFIKRPRSSFKRHPFIVIDSNNQTHRDLISKKLAKRLKAKVVYNPPECLSEHKIIYREYNPLHRAFNVLGMYAAAHSVQANYIERPVVLSGYWNYATAVALDEIFPSIDLLLKDSSFYRFPKDLLLPDITIFINIKKDFPMYNMNSWLKKKENPRWKTILKKMKEHPIVIIDSCVEDVNIVSEIEQDIELRISPQILVKKQKRPMW